ncbi:MAG: NapC/NirT family cytochrome c [Candidatus Lindowbacteria bacterium]|nr:NapC/NirT family cytochrome c [Candidatus Lindowbacteria bacterium]
MGENKPNNNLAAGRSKVSSLKWALVVVILVIPATLLASHEVALRYFQEATCSACHEMKDIVRKWKDSGAAKNHKDCMGCHFDKGFNGWLEMNKAAAVELVAHFSRKPDEPLVPPDEPLFWEGAKEPGYWSLVPNHRCFQCHEAKSHGEIDQPRIHAGFINDIASRPCKDCHSHEMRNGRKFYEKVSEEEQTAPSGSQT